MREIKFRAWDGEKMWEIDDNSKIVLEFNKISGWNILPNKSNYQGEYLAGESATNKEFHLMQFTGFKDYNGKEIYEGDILSNEVETDEGIINSSLQVFWNETSGNWSLDYSFKQDKTACCALHADLNKYKYKVVGNIFENNE